MSALVDQFGDPVKSAFNAPAARMAFAAVDGGGYGYGLYDALQYSTQRAVRPFFAVDSARTLTAWNRLRALALARWSYINVHFVRGAVDLNARLTVGTGFTCRSLAKDTGWAKQADAITAAKFRNIGFTAGESMDELLLHDSRGVDVDGGIGYVMTEDEQGAEKLQLIEAHRIIRGSVSDARCVDGVWMDAYGRRTDYNVLLPGESDTQKTRRIAAQNFIYLAERNRPDEPQSITNLIHALNPLQDLYEIVAFEMASVKKNSEIGLTVETPTPDRPPLGPPVDIFAAEAMAASGSQPAQPKQFITREMVYGGGGKVPILTPGEKLVAHDHTRPGPGIEGWNKFIIRGIAIGFGLPFEVLWDPESIGGANTRLITALLRARLEQRRKNIIFPKLMRARFWVLSRAIKRGELSYHPEMGKVGFQPNFSDITVDAGRESRERRANVLQGLDTFTSYDAENGNDYLGTSLPTREVEIAAQCAAAERLCAKYPGMSFQSALDRIAMLTPNSSAVDATAAEPASQKTTAPKK